MLKTKMEKNKIEKYKATFGGLSIVLCLALPASGWASGTTDLKALSGLSSNEQAAAWAVNQIAGLRSQLESATARITTLSESNSSLQNSVSTLTEQNSSLTSQISNLNVTIANLTGQITTLQSQLESETIQNALLSGIIVDLNLQVSNLRLVNTSLEFQIATLNAQIASSNQQIASLTTERDGLVQRLADLSEQLAVLSAEIVAGNAERDSLVAQNTDLRARLTTAEGIIAGAELKLATGPYKAARDAYAVGMILEDKIELVNNYVAATDLKLATGPYKAARDAAFPDLELAERIAKINSEFSEQATELTSTQERLIFAGKQLEDSRAVIAGADLKLATGPYKAARDFTEQMSLSEKVEKVNTEFAEGVRQFSNLSGSYLAQDEKLTALETAIAHLEREPASQTPNSFDNAIKTLKNIKEVKSAFSAADGATNESIAACSIELSDITGTTTTNSGLIDTVGCLAGGGKRVWGWCIGGTSDLTPLSDNPTVDPQSTNVTVLNCYIGGGAPDNVFFPTYCVGGAFDLELITPQAAAVTVLDCILGGGAPDNAFNPTYCVGGISDLELITPQAAAVTVIDCYLGGGAPDNVFFPTYCVGGVSDLELITPAAARMIPVNNDDSNSSGTNTTSKFTTSKRCLDAGCSISSSGHWCKCPERNYQIGEGNWSF